MYMMGQNSSHLICDRQSGPGGETWAGRGAKPRWLAALLKEGHSIQDFAIAQSGGKKTGCTEGAEGGRQKSRSLSDAPLANSVAICGAGIADPCVSGKPLVRGAARCTKRATEEYGHRGKSRTLNEYARRDGLPCLGATNHD